MKINYKDIFSSSLLNRILLEFYQNDSPLSFNEIGELLDNSPSVIRTTMNRDDNKLFFQEDKKEKNIKYFKLSSHGKKIIDIKIKEYEDKLKEQELKEKLKDGMDIEKEELFYQLKGFISLYKTIIKNNTDKYLDKDNNVIKVDAQDILEYNPEIYEKLKESPKDIFKLFNLAFEEDGTFGSTAIVRIYNLPETESLLIENVRTEHLDNLISIRGKIIQATDARPQCINTKWECPICGSELSIEQLEKKLREPTRCSCGRRGGFKIVSKNMIDSARLIVQDLHENSKSSNSKRLNCFVSLDLASKKILNTLLQPGNEIIMVGVLEEIQVSLPGGGISTTSDIALNVNSVYISEEEVSLDNISEEDLEEINKLSKNIDDNGLEVITPSFAPVISGNEYVKQALVLYPCNRLNRPGQDEERNKSNILLIGDSSTAKSVLAKFLIDVCIGSKKVVGGNTTGVGITGAVTKDEFLGGWMLNPGALVLAKGLLFIEEFNTMDDRDKAQIQDAIESQYVDITKAAVSGRYKVRTGIIACANPLYGNFNDSNSMIEIVRQFGINSATITRFDSIFLYKDVVNEDTDYEIAMKMKRRKYKSLSCTYKKTFLKKFFHYINCRDEPIMNEKIMELSSRIYASIRSYNDSSNQIKPRTNEAIDRMCIASAKIRGSNVIEEKDLERVINILSRSYFTIPDYKTVKEKLIKKSKDSKKIYTQKILSCFKEEKEILNIDDISKQTKLDLQDLQNGINKLKGDGLIYSLTEDNYQLM